MRSISMPGRQRWTVVIALVFAVLTMACQDPGAIGPSGKPSASAPRGDLPSSMAALGDSITAGVGSCFDLHACTRNSWSTGDGRLVDSQYRRIAALNPAMKGHAANYARAGATAADLPGQVAQAVKSKPDYVTILIGANDACRDRIEDMTAPSKFRAEIDAALGTLKAKDSGVRLLIASIPDIYHVWEIGHNRRLPTTLWKLGVCQSLLANPTSTAPADVARRQQFRDRIDAYNKALADACVHYGSHCRWDGGAVFRARFSIGDLSALDFFHPNVTGQDKLADATWPDAFSRQ